MDAETRDAGRQLRALPAVAREAIAARLDSRSPRAVAEPRGALERSAPVFVTLRIAGELRGCVGELEAQHDDLVAETTDRAIAAAFEDPRFPPITPDELDRATIDVSVLGPLEPVSARRDLDPRRYGVVVADSDGRRGVLLPDIDGVDTAEQQVAIACRKAGITAEADTAIWRFPVTKVAE